MERPFAFCFCLNPRCKTAMLLVWHDCPFFDSSWMYESFVISLFLFESLRDEMMVLKWFWKMIYKGKWLRDTHWFKIRCTFTLEVFLLYCQPELWCKQTMSWVGNGVPSFSFVLSCKTNTHTLLFLKSVYIFALKNTYNFDFC